LSSAVESSEAGGGHRAHYLHTLALTTFVVLCTLLRVESYETEVVMFLIVVYAALPLVFLTLGLWALYGPEV
jgi:hypothetical protein